MPEWVLEATSTFDQHFFHDPFNLGSFQLHTYIQLHPLQTDQKREREKSSKEKDNRGKDYISSASSGYLGLVRSIL